MNADLTINSIVFRRLFDDKAESLRRSTTRGINLPDEMSVKTSAYTESSTKVPGNRYTLRFDRVIRSADGLKKANVAAYVVLLVPEIAESTDVSSVVSTLRAAVATEGLVEGVLNGER